VDRTKIDRLIALLHAQRGEAARRSIEVRGSQGWADSSNRLEMLNEQIMRLGAAPTEPSLDEPEGSRAIRDEQPD
jgi:hypothetical protein